MKKESFYFPHYTNTKSDPRVIRMRRMHGWQAYGIYVALKEVLREQDTLSYPLAYLEDLAFDLQVDIGLLGSIVNDFGLFDVTNGEIVSSELIDSLASYFEKSEIGKKKAEKRWAKSKEAFEKESVSETSVMQVQCNSNAGALHVQCNSNADAMQSNQIKSNQIKSNQSKSNMGGKTAKHAFCKSPYNDFEIFKSCIGDKYQAYDLEFYHETAKNYSESKGAAYLDWLAAIRNWILKDLKDGNKRVFKPTGPPADQEAERKRKLMEAFEKLNDHKNN